MANPYKFRPTHGSGMGIVHLDKSSIKTLEDVCPRVKVGKSRDPVMRRRKAISRKQAITANSIREASLNGHEHIPHVLMDLERNVLKSKMMSKEEAARRNKEIKSLGYAWCQGAYEGYKK